MMNALSLILALVLLVCSQDSSAIDGNSSKHYAYRSSKSGKIHRIATPTVVVKTHFRFPYYAYRSYPVFSTTPTVVSDVILQAIIGTGSSNR
jgi:hypothetical protein